MADTVPGGVYEDSPGSGTYHDANGEPVTPEAMAEYKKLQAEQAAAAQVAADEEMRLRSLQLSNLSQVLGAAVKPPTVPQQQPPQVGAQGAGEDERRIRRS